MPSERLQKLLARAGVASRRKCEELITAGKVTVNGRRVTELGSKADPARDRIKVNGRDLPRPVPTYLIFHKPTSVITSLADPEGRENISDFLPPNVPRVYPVGRLDWDTQGVLLLTNDGELANRLMHPSREIPKVYRVKVAGSPGGDVLQRLADGVDYDVERTDSKTGRVTVETVRTSPAHEVVLLGERAGKSWIRLVIHEGRNRQVKRMCEAVGLRILKLRRDVFAGLTAQGVPLGKLRALKPEEIAHVRDLAGLPPKPKRGQSGAGANVDAWTPNSTMRDGKYGPFGGPRPPQTRKSSKTSRRPAKSRRPEGPRRAEQTSTPEQTEGLSRPGKSKRPPGGRGKKTR